MGLSVYGVNLRNYLSNNLRDCNSVITVFTSEEILDFNLLVTVLIYSATIHCFHGCNFAITLQEQYPVPACNEVHLLRYFTRVDFFIFYL